MFLGDSSLGNAINAGHWARLSGKPALNLALTGFHGPAGTEVMLRHVLRSGAPVNVVVFQTVEVFRLPPPPDRYRVQGPDSAPKSVGSIVEKFWSDYMTTRQLRLSLRWLARSPTGNAAGDAVAMVDDYVPQRAPTNRRLQKCMRCAGSRRYPRASFPSITSIAQLCSQARLNCIYVHGPLAEPACDGARDYIRRVSERLAAAGLAPASGHPLCMPLAHTGDTTNHVAPGHKLLYTERYWQLLRATLR